MSAGRCSGCGLENKSCKVIRTHVNTCSEYVALFKATPERCLDPEEEYAAYHAWLKTPDGQAWKAEHNAEKHKARRAEVEARIDASHARWSSTEVT